MSQASSNASRPAIIGRPAWRVTVLGEADRLDARLASAVAADPAAAQSPSVAAIRQASHRARTIAQGKSSRGPVDWWSGTSIESAWQALHLAQEELMMVLPTQELRAEAPHLAALVQGTFTGDRQKSESDAVASMTASAADPLAARRILVAYHARSDAQHQSVRRLRNLLYVVLTGLTALVIALWATGVTSGEVVGLGALAGALSVVFALRAGTPSGPYNLMLPQALLKVAGGAATALMAVKVLDVINGSATSAARDSMYAIVFGFSQQAFTRLVDQQASALAKGPDPRSGSAAPAAAAVAS